MSGTVGGVSKFPDNDPSGHPLEVCKSRDHWMDCSVIPRGEIGPTDLCHCTDMKILNYGPEKRICFKEICQMPDGKGQNFALRDFNVRWSSFWPKEFGRCNF
jgi:hypothetical protein